MDAVARSRLLNQGAGEQLLAVKLQILNGTGVRRPSSALAVLTGAAPAPLEPAVAVDEPSTRAARRTVYLSERHLRDIDLIIGAWQENEPRRLNRSAVLRRAIEHLRTLVESETDQCLRRT
jgi:hypothetical protein